MAKALDNVCPPIPGIRSRLIGFELSTVGVEEGNLPAILGQPQIHGEGQGVALVFTVYRWQCFEVGPDVLEIRYPNPVEVDIGKGGKRIGAIGANTLFHNLNEVGLAPFAQPGSRIRCDIGCIERAEGGRNGQSPREGLPALGGGMAGQAIPDLRQVFSAPYGVGLCP